MGISHPSLLSINLSDNPPVSHIHQSLPVPLLGLLPEPSQRLGSPEPLGLALCSLSRQLDPRAVELLQRQREQLGLLLREQETRVGIAADRTARRDRGDLATHQDEVVR